MCAFSCFEVKKAEKELELPHNSYGWVCQSKGSYLGMSLF